MKKLTEVEKLKYWLDAEISYLHAMLAFVLLQIVKSGWAKVALIVYIVVSLVYMIVRVAYVAQHDKNYLKVPKQK